MTEVDRAKKRLKDRVSPAKGQENRQGGNAQEAQDQHPLKFKEFVEDRLTYFGSASEKD